MGKIVEQFIGREIDVVESDDLRRRLLHHLRAPAGLAACVEALANLEAQFLPHTNQRREMPARRAIGVMIVVGPAQTQAILSCLLTLSRAVFALPVFALGGEEDVAGAIDAKLGDRRVEEAMGPCEPGCFVVEFAIAAAEG